MSLLALDLGTDTGYAISSGGVKVSGHINFAPQKTRSFDGGGMRYLRFQRWLNEIHANTPITEVVFEEVRAHQGVTAAHKYGGFLAVLTAWCEEHNIPYSTETVGNIKAFATGKRGASKDAMIAAVKEKWGFTTKSDDEADAIALLHLKLYDILN